MIKKIGDIVLLHLSDTDSNIYVRDGFVIDAGTGFNFTRLMDFFRIMKKDMNDIEWVINTHGHFDHVGGNGYFFNAKVAIHEADAPIIENADPELSVADYFEGQMKPREVGKRLKDGDEISGLKVIHTPGHSAGSICLYDEKNKVLFSGDTVFADGIGRTDLPGSDEKAMQESLEKLSKLDIDKILPGHGDPVLENGNKKLEEIKKLFSENV